jgi:site-specific DNA recombinase
MTRAVGYIRVSTQDQAREGFSLSAQRHRIEAYCKAQGWELVEIYADEGVTGSTIDRPEFQRMFDEVLSDGVEKIIFVKLDRLGRCAYQLGAVRDRLEKRGVGLVSITEQYDTSTSIGRFFWTLLAAFAELERDVIRERCAAGREEKARQGRGWIVGRVPFGYEIDEYGAIVPTPDQVEAVRFIFRWASHGRDSEWIARQMNRRGYPSPAGVGWNSQTVRRIRHRTIYRGEYEFKGHRIEVPHIVSRRLWRKAQVTRGQAKAKKSA